MKVVLLTTGRLGNLVLEYFEEIQQPLAGVVSLKDQNVEYLEGIIEKSAKCENRIVIVDDPKDTKKILNEWYPDLILSVYWPFILSKEVINIPKEGIINFHLSLIPFNRGANPNVWPIIENTPAGVTLHFIDENVDSGEIIVQKEVEISITDTAETLFIKLNEQMIKMFKEEWPKIISKEIKPFRPDLNRGTFHLRKDFESLKEIDLKKKVLPLDLINHIRAKTFNDKKGAYFLYEGKKVYLKIELTQE